MGHAPEVSRNTTSNCKSRNGESLNNSPSASAHSVPDLTVIVPVYNEARILTANLATIYEYLSGEGFDFEMLLVDDGSTDRSAALIEAFAARDRQRVVVESLDKNQGKGAAVRRGLARARGSAIVFCDADLSVAIINVAAARAKLAQGFDIVIASRRKSGGGITRYQQPHRVILGLFFLWFSRALLQLQVSDVTCGFKALTAEARQRLLPEMTVDGWAFDAELLFRARRQGLRIGEIPVFWRDEPGTKVRVGHAILASLRDLLRIRLSL